MLYDSVLDPNWSSADPYLFSIIAQSGSGSGIAVATKAEFFKFSLSFFKFPVFYFLQSTNISKIYCTYIPGSKTTSPSGIKACANCKQFCIRISVKDFFLSISLPLGPDPFTIADDISLDTKHALKKKRISSSLSNLDANPENF